MSGGGNADCTLAVPEDYTTKYGFQFSQFSPIAELEEEESSVEDNRVQNVAVKRTSSLKRNIKLKLQQPPNDLVSPKPHPPPLKYPKPPKKTQSEAVNKSQDLPTSPMSLKSPLSPPRVTQQPAGKPVQQLVGKPVQPVTPLSDRPAPSDGASGKRDKPLAMQHYKLHHNSRSFPAGLSSSSGAARPYGHSQSNSPSSEPNSENNSGNSTPMYDERCSPSGSSCSTSTASGAGQQQQHKAGTQPPIAKTSHHSFSEDAGGRKYTNPNKTASLHAYHGELPEDHGSYSQPSARSKHEMYSPEQRSKFTSPDSQRSASMEDYFQNMEMPSMALRHSANPRFQKGRKEEYYSHPPKAQNGYVSDGGLSTTSSIEELSAINLIGDYNSQPSQPNVVVVKPQPAYYQAHHHPGFKERNTQVPPDGKPYARGSGPPTQPAVHPSVSLSPGKQGGGHAYHASQFAKGPPLAYHGQHKHPQQRTTQRQGPPPPPSSGGSGGGLGKPMEYGKTAVSPPSVREGKPRGYLPADGMDYANEMIAAYRAHEAAVSGDFVYLHRVVSSNEIPPTLADQHKSTLIHKAALNGHLKCLSFLVKNSPRDAVNLLDDNLLTPVLLAIQGGFLECARWLVEETDVSMVVPDAGGETLLHHAAFHGKVNVLEWLLEKVKKNDMKGSDIVDDSGVTPAHFAAQQGHLDCLQMLYDKGCCLTIADHDNQRPVDWADASNQLLCSHYLFIVETCWQLSGDIALLKQQLGKVQAENQSLRDVIGGMEKEHSKNMNKVQLQCEAKIEKIRESYVDLTAKLLQDAKETQQQVGGGGKPPVRISPVEISIFQHHQVEIDKAKDGESEHNISGLAQEVLRKRQSSVAQRMLESREMRRRQPVLAGRASPLSPSLQRTELYAIPATETDNTRTQYRKVGARMVTFAPHVEEFPKSPSPSYSSDFSLHTVKEENFSENPELMQSRYHENTD